MLTGVAIIIVTIGILIVLFIYYSIVNRSRQCATNPTIACYNTWTCEADPNRLGNLQCPNGDCKTAIENLYNQASPCASGCSSDCQCRWNTNTTATPPTPNTAPCSLYNHPGYNVGAYICGQYGQMRCGTEGHSPCNPLCEDPTQPGCC